MREAYREERDAAIVGDFIARHWRREGVTTLRALTTLVSGVISPIKTG